MEGERREKVPPDILGSELYAELLLEQGHAPKSPLVVCPTLGDAAAGPTIRARFGVGPKQHWAAEGEAVRFYRELLDIWRNADADLPALKEAQNYVQQHGAQ